MTWNLNGARSASRTTLDHLQDFVELLEGRRRPRSPDGLPTATDTDWSGLRVAAAELLSLPANLTAAANAGDARSMQEILGAMLLAPATMASEMITVEHANRVAGIMQATAMLMGALADVPDGRVLALDTLAARQDAAGLVKRWKGTSGALYNAVGECCHVRLFSALLDLYRAPEMKALLSRFGLDGTPLAKGIKRALNVIKRVKNYSVDQDQVERDMVYNPQQANLIARVETWEPRGDALRYAFKDGSALVIQGGAVRYQGGGKDVTIAQGMHPQHLAQNAADWFRVHLASDSDGIGLAGLAGSELESPGGFLYKNILEHRSSATPRVSYRGVLGERLSGVDKRLVDELLQTGDQMLLREIGRQLKRAGGGAAKAVFTRLFQALKDRSKRRLYLSMLHALQLEAGTTFTDLDKALKDARLDVRLRAEIVDAISLERDLAYMLRLPSLTAGMPEGEILARRYARLIKQGGTKAEAERLAQDVFDADSASGQRIAAMGMRPNTEAFWYRLSQLMFEVGVRLNPDPQGDSVLEGEGVLMTMGSGDFEVEVRFGLIQVGPGGKPEIRADAEIVTVPEEAEGVMPHDMLSIERFLDVTDASMAGLRVAVTKAIQEGTDLIMVADNWFEEAQAELDAGSPYLGYDA